MVFQYVLRNTQNDAFVASFVLLTVISPALVLLLWLDHGKSDSVSDRKPIVVASLISVVTVVVLTVNDVIRDASHSPTHVAEVIVEGDEDPLWLLGAPFLKKNTVLPVTKSMGKAKLKVLTYPIPAPDFKKSISVLS